jgi:hypothetical protein
LSGPFNIIIFQFFVGWWIDIDAAAAYPDQKEFHHACQTCGVVATVALFL